MSSHPHTQPPAEQPQLPHPEIPDELARKSFVITIIGAAAFVGVVLVFVL